MQRFGPQRQGQEKRPDPKFPMRAAMWETLNPSRMDGQPQDQRKAASMVRPSAPSP